MMNNRRLILTFLVLISSSIALSKKNDDKPLSDKDVKKSFKIIVLSGTSSLMMKQEE